jgi:anti-sigma-K factor RskA
MRNLKQPHGPLEPQDIEELLPWYATGRLSREEARGIEAALKTMPDLAAKLAAVQRERDAIARGSEAVEPPPPDNLQRLLRQVETTRQQRPGKAERPAGLEGWLAAFFGRRLVWQVAFGIACIAIAVMAMRFYDPSTAVFETTAGINGAQGEATLVVTFQPQAPNADVTSLLRDVKVIVVDGPRPGGSYVVRLPSAEPKDVSAVMERLLTRKDLVQSVLRGSEP